VPRQLITLAGTIPAENYSWRASPGVRSTSEVLMHVAISNYWLLSVNGPKMPAQLKPGSEKTITSKEQVIDWLKRSLDAVRIACVGLTPADIHRKVRVNGRDASIDGTYLRIFVHANEHMGQLVAYARMNGIVPPWSAK
jgi:uncharacterized damage-inducible protein DinB